ncbi:hypothetical protein HID58_002271 [Brassica napus]|uniref:D-fructose-1,6-bisphosphate 1-phosphohydrolase n=1 Tax=Brassica napus TaxID=3708 RepID=A0ABQ8ELS7_BRANA|nr:hypothetical protein HID58_002271 [Brassica napus]
MVTNDTGTTSTASLLRVYAKVRIVVCDSLDGSSNIDAEISSDSIFGIYNPNDKCNTDDCDYNSALGSEERSCIEKVSLPSPWTQCMATSSSRKRTLRSLKLGSFNLSKKGTTSHGIKYIGDLKDLGPIGKPYSAINKTLLYGGIYVYPCDAKSKNGKLRLLYEYALMNFILEEKDHIATRVLDIQLAKDNSKHISCLVYYISLHLNFGCHHTKFSLGYLTEHQKVTLYVGSKE